MVGIKDFWTKRMVISGLALLSFGISSQAVAADEYWTLVNAPITYKMANPSDLTGYKAAPHAPFIPQTTPTPGAATPSPTYQMPQPKTQTPRAPVPQVSVPQMLVPSVPVPMASQSGVSLFDPSRVDQNLYPHQRVGKTYTVAGKSYTPEHQPRYDMVGTASWYGDKFHGKLTANGEKYDKNGMTAAHKTLPLNSLVVVTSLQTGVSITLRINDRGPFIGERIIDLSEAAANIMGIKTTGLGNVRVQYAGPAAVNSVAAPQQFLSQPISPQKEAARPSNPLSAQPILPSYPVQAPFPAPTLPDYQPLRNMGAKPQVMAPHTAQLQVRPMRIPDVMNPVSIIPQAALPTMPHSIPEAYIPPQPQGGADDTVVTMTISGPIHMAGHQVHGSQIYFVPSSQYPVK